jgi:hypothetical protein
MACVCRGLVGGLTHRRESTGTIAHAHTLSHTALTHIMHVHAEYLGGGGAVAPQPRSALAA